MRKIPMLTLVAVLAAAGACGAHEFGLRLNPTASMPVGLWRVSAVDGPLHRGETVSLCLPTAVSALARQRGYIDGGECPGDYAPLLKPIAAVAGDVVEVGQGGISVNGVQLRDSAALAHDEAGRPLQAVPDGRYVVPTGFVWVISEHNPLSFDSRYFGPVPASNVLGRASPVFVEGTP